MSAYRKKFNLISSMASKGMDEAIKSRKPSVHNLSLNFDQVVD
jgi:hypothetical protein